MSSPTACISSRDSAIIRSPQSCPLAWEAKSLWLTAVYPSPDFNQGASYQTTTGSSIYNGLQTKLEQQLSNGVNFLATYTWSKTMSDAGDLLNGGSLNGNRAPFVPGFGPRFDWSPADFDIRNVFHLSGGYELPFGTGKRFASDAGKAENYAIGGWSVNAIVTLQGGQPLTIGTQTGTTSGTGSYAVKVAGQPQKQSHSHRWQWSGQLVRKPGSVQPALPTRWPTRWTLRSNTGLSHGLHSVYRATDSGWQPPSQPQPPA